MNPSPAGKTEKVTPIKATYYPAPKPHTPHARRLTLIERIKQAVR